MPQAVPQDAENLDEFMQIGYLTPGNAEFFATPGGFAGLRAGEKEYPRVTVGRVFPLTDPESFLTVREPDAKGREIGMIRTLGDFDEKTAALLRAQLELRYFMPKIEKILSLKEEYGYGYFSAVTDKGPSKFVVHIYGRSFVRLSENRYIITDIDGNRFELPDLTALSGAERKKLDLYL